MGKTVAKNAIVLINGYLYSTYTTAYDKAEGAGPIDVTGFGDGCQNFIPGELTAQINATMLWDSTATTGVIYALNSMPSGVVTIIPEGWTLGNKTLSLPFQQANYAPQGKPNDAIRIGTINFMSYGNNQGLEDGWALQHGTITNTTTGTGFDDPTDAAVTAVCTGTLHIWTPTSTDTYVVKIQHSTTLGSGYADLVTFAATGTTRTVERQTIASGGINKYRRIIATRTGSAGDTFGFSVHFWHA